MDNRLHIVEARNKLKARPSPYWVTMGTGRHLGFRKLSASSLGTWYVRFYDPGQGKQTPHSLGTFDDLPPSQRFDAAKKAAESWLKHMNRGGVNDRLTVASACVEYVKHLAETKGQASAEDAASRFRRHVDVSKIASIDLSKLESRHVEAWRTELRRTPVKSGPKGAEKKMRTRSESAINRDMTALRAALNFALTKRAVTSDWAWREALKPIKDADRRREAYLDREQRTRLIELARPDLAVFLRALAMVPLRPGALAALTVSSFDKRLSVLTVGKDKTGNDRKMKLPPNLAEFFLEQSRHKLPSAPLLARADGKAWDKDAWKGPVKAAATAAGLGPQVTAYALRHSAITDLVTSGLDLMTVAQLSGTSVAMIEKHYAHLGADHAAAALAGLAL